MTNFEKNSYSKKANSKSMLKRFATFALSAALLLQPLAINNVKAINTGDSATSSEISPIVNKKTSLKPKNVRISLSTIMDWSPENEDFDYIQRASVPLKDREKGAPINEYASEEARIQSLTYMLGNNLGRYSSVGDYEFNVNTFDKWQYVDTLITWDSIIPSPDVIDAGHKNGTPVMGTLFFNWSSSYEDNIIFQNFIKQDDNGKYPVARKLAEIAVHYGFDGYFFNQETTGFATTGQSEKLRDLILEMKAHARSLGKEIIIGFYDAMANSGGRNHYNALVSGNNLWMTPVNGEIPVDDFFPNFNWGQNRVSDSITQARSIGRDPFDVHFGFELQQDVSYSRSLAPLLGPDNKLRTSVGLFIPDTINGQAEKPEDLHDAINKFWTGDNRNPANITDSGYYGMGARNVVDQTPILTPELYTSFNTGHGRHWFRDGVKTITQDWNQRSVQDVLPTWTWWMESNVDGSLDAYYDFEDAYNGGSSVKVYGNLPAYATSRLNLYSTNFVATADTYIDVTYKGGRDTSIHFAVNTNENYAESGYREFRLSDSHDGWTTQRISLSSLAGQSIQSLGLKFENTTQLNDYKFNLGQIVIGTNDTKPVAPQNFEILESAILSGVEAEAIVQFERVEGAYRYDVYAVNGDHEDWVFSSSSNMIYLPRLRRLADSTETIQELKVYAVNENGQVSEGAITEFDWLFAATETTPAAEKAPNITPEARMLSPVIPGDEESKMKLINDTLIDLTDKWGSSLYRDDVIIEFDEPRSVVRWRMELAGHAGESKDDGLMNAKSYNLEVERNGQWEVVKEVRNNILHVTDITFDEPVVGQKWRFNLLERDNGTPWGYIRIYNWKMYERLDPSDNIPMTSVDSVYQEDNLFTFRFNKEKLSRFYDQDMSKFHVSLYRDPAATDLVETKTFDDNGHIMFTDVEVENENGALYYRTTEEGKEPSNILAVAYEKPSTRSILEDKVAELENRLAEIGAANTPESVEALKEKLALANALLDNTDATDQELTDAYDALVQAEENLEEIVEIPTIENPLVENAKIVSIDAGRRYYSVDQIKEIIDIISESGFEYLHLLLGNDGMRFLLDDMTINANGTTYASEDVKAGIRQGNIEYSASKNVTENQDATLTQAEMDQIFAYAAEKGIEVIPAINMPGHMDAILVAMEELGIEDPNYYNGNRKSVTTLDIQKEQVVEFAKEFAQLYIDYFSSKGVKVYTFGADEYANDAFGNPGWQNLINLGLYDKFIDFANDLSERALIAGMRPMAYNDGFYYNGRNAELNEQLIIAYWTAGWWGFDVAPTTRFVSEGHDVLNVNDGWYYVVGNETSADGIYDRQSAMNRMSQANFKFDRNVGTQIDTIGSMISLWNDNPAKPYDVEKLREWVETFANENPLYFDVEEDPEQPEEPEQPTGPFKNPIVISNMIITNPQGWWVYSFGAPGNSANNMIDENDSTFTWWAAPDGRAGYRAGDYFGLDLGQEYYLGRFRVAMGTQASGELDHLYKYRIRYSSDGQTWTTFGEEITQLENFKVTDVNLNNVKARYIVVEATDSRDYWVKISDFMVETFEDLPVDKDLLQERYDEIQAELDSLEDTKTPESLDNLYEKLERAFDVLTGTDVDQDAIDQTLAELNEAYENLEDIVVTSEPFINPIVNENMVIKYPNTYWIYNASPNNKISNMIDGNDSTFAWWATDAPGYRPGDYFGLDLGKEYELGRFRMVMGNSSEFDRFSEYRIRYSNDGQTWTTYGDNIVQTTDSKVTDFVFEDVQARYVIVESLSSGDYWVQISEFMVETTEIPEEPQVDKTALAEAIDKANAIDTEGKTQESVAALQEAIANATQVLANEDASQEDVNQAVSSLEAAINALEDEPVVEIVDASALETLLEKARSIDTSTKTTDSAQRLIDAIFNADQVVNNLERSQEDVDKAIQDIVDALAGLEDQEEIQEPEEPAVDKTNLEKLVDNALKVNTTDKTEESVAIFDQALENAYSILDSDQASQEEVDSAVDSLLAAITGLELKEQEPIQEPEVVDKSALETLVDKISGLDQTNLTQESKDNITNALEEAKQVLEDEQVSKEQVQDQVNKLVDLLLNLEEVEEEVIPETPEIPVNKGLLGQVIERAQNIDTSDKTEESVNNLNSQIAQAKEILENSDSTQEQVDLAVVRLVDVIIGLTAKEVEPEVVKVKPRLTSEVLVQVKENEPRQVTYVSNGEYPSFVKVEINGQEVARENYNLEEGSTILTFTQDYIDSLEVGTHLVEMFFNESDSYLEGSVNGVIEILAVKDDLVIEDGEDITIPGETEDELVIEDGEDITIPGKPSDDLVIEDGEDITIPGQTNDNQGQDGDDTQTPGKPADKPSAGNEGKPSRPSRPNDSDNTGSSNPGRVIAGKASPTTGDTGVVMLAITSALAAAGFILLNKKNK